MAYPYKGKHQGKKGKGESPRQGNRIRSVSQGAGIDWDELWEKILELEEWARQGWLKAIMITYRCCSCGGRTRETWEGPMGRVGRERGQGKGMRHLGENRGREAQGKGMRDLGENRGREARVRSTLREYHRERHMARGRKLLWGWRRRQRVRDEAYMRWQLDFAYTQS